MAAVRIALVVAGGFDESGRDVTPSLHALVERLAIGNRVTVYVLQYLREPRRYSMRGASISDLGRPPGLWRQYRALVRAIREEGRPDVLHGYMALPSGFVAAAAGRRLGIPSVLTCDSGEFAALPEVPYGLQLRSRQRLAVAAVTEMATRVTVCSEYQRGLASRHRVAAEVIPIGVDTGRFVPAPGPDGPPWRLVHAASLNRVKDQAALLHALKHVKRAADVHLDVAGEDTLGGSVQRLASDLGLGDAVTFHGRLPLESLLPLYQRAHLHIVSSRHEAANVAMLEAAACGVPTVGTRVGYVADFEPERAVAVPVGDASALARAILALLDDSGRRRAIGQAARGWVLAHDADWTARRFLGVYAALVPSAI
jgi:glycosyltransferase involved in cell wall biosynthesis